MITTTQFLFILTLFAALGCGLIAGAFFAFSAFVMKALARLPVAQGIAAMQSINIAVLNAWFLTVFLGTAVLCLVIIILAFPRWPQSQSLYLLIGSVLYLAGSLLVTRAFNIPKNDALATLTPAHPDSADLWADYLSTWTTWNHVRTVASLAAAASFSLALRS